MANFWYVIRCFFFKCRVLRFGRLSFCAANAGKSPSRKRIRSIRATADERISISSPAHVDIPFYRGIPCKIQCILGVDNDDVMTDAFRTVETNHL